MNTPRSCSIFTVATSLLECPAVGLVVTRRRGVDQRFHRVATLIADRHVVEVVGGARRQQAIAIVRQALVDARA